MIIKDQNHHKIISKDCKRVTSLIDKIFGLLISTSPPALLFKTRFGIHTFGLGKSIDVLVLDSRNRIVKMKPSLRPNQVFVWNPKYFYVLELPEGTIKKHRIKIGDELIFEA